MRISLTLSFSTSSTEPVFLLVNQTVTKIENNDPTKAGSSAPVNLAIITCGIAIPTPDIKVIKTIPLRALILLPVRITKIKGTKITKMTNCKVTINPNCTSLRLVTSANVKTGKPIAPNAVAVLLATKQITEAWIGSKPKEIKIPAQIATAVPKPAIDSRKPPKPQAIINTKILLSVVIDDNNFSIVPILPESVVIWYIKSAAKITYMIGQIPIIIPSKAPERILIMGCLNIKTASAIVIIKPIVHALEAGIPIIPREIINQMIGTNAHKKFIHIVFLI